MIDDEQKKRIMHKILQSKQFASAPTYQNLLAYLTECSIKRDIPKEANIAKEVFKRNDSFNPTEDPIVRVYCHNLRNKLKDYYEQEGKDDNVRVEITKGRYTVRFLPTPKIKKRSKEITKSKIVVLYFIIIFFSGIILFLWLQNRSLSGKLDPYSDINNNYPIWKDYFQSSLPTLIILGNHFFFSEYSEKAKRWRYIRDITINSYKELQVFKGQNPDIEIKDDGEVYFPMECVWSLPSLLSLFYSHSHKLLFRQISEIRPSDLRTNNIIFIGSIKTLGILDNYFSSSHFSYQLHPSKIFYRPTDSDTVETFTTIGISKGYTTDLAVALKFPGPNKNSIFIITSFHWMGAPQAARYLTDPASLAQLQNKFIEKYKVMPEYFEALFEAKGIEITGFNVKLKYFGELPASFEISLPQ